MIIVKTTPNQTLWIGEGEETTNPLDDVALYWYVYFTGEWSRSPIVMKMEFVHYHKRAFETLNDEDQLRILEWKLRR